MRNKTCKIGLSLAVALMLSSAALAAPETQLPAFETLDANVDGYISVEEAQEGKMLTDTFESADGNKDHMLDKVEYASVLAE